MNTTHALSEQFAVFIASIRRVALGAVFEKYFAIQRVSSEY